MPSKHLTFCLPLLLLPQTFPASGSFPISQLFLSAGQILELQLYPRPFNECSGLISFKSDWFDLLPVQGTLKSLLQHHSWKVSIFQHSAFFMVQLSHPHMTTRKKSQLGLYGPFSGNLSMWCFKIYMSHLIINLFYFGVFLLLSNCFYKLRAANRGSIRCHIDMLTVKLGSITRINVCICASLGMCACAFMTKTSRTFNNRNIHDHHHSL